MRKLALLSILAFAALPLAGAQSFSFQSGRLPVVELTGHFRFHTGDDARWSAPGFDDSRWQLLRSGETWFDQGYRNYSGMAWYRFTITVPAQHPPLALYVPRILDSFQIFVNGRLIGGSGPMPPHARVIIARRLVFPIPPNVALPGQPLVFALRVWHWPHWAMYYGGGPAGPLRIGDASLIRQWQAAQDQQNFWQDSSAGFLFLITLLAGLAGLALFAMHRADREYLWFGLYEIFWAAVYATALYLSFHPYVIKSAEAFERGLELVAYFSFIQFVASVTRRRRGLLYWAAIVSVTAFGLAFLPGIFEWMSVSVWNTIMGVAFLPFELAILALLTAGARRKIRDAQLLLIPVGLSYLVDVAERALWITFSSGYTAIGPLRAHLLQVTTWPFPISAFEITDFLTQLAILAILVLRFTRTRRDEQRWASELEAARAVQQVLIPEETTAVPGFGIQCVYKPAGEVGGDFFQIVHTPAGGVLAVVGDVSGKGMPAAMAVSLLVGTFRTLAHYSQSPGEILAAMNQRMMGRTGGGFTTCLVLRIDAGGAMALANAGHLAPYRNGEEIPVESGLPLGVEAGASYAESELPLQPGDILTLVSDGVVEAKTSSGELFGFDRTREISIQPAEEIARAAQAFGQHDDITVLTLTFAPVEVLHA